MARIVRAVAERFHFRPELRATRLPGLLEVPRLSLEVPALGTEALGLGERRLRAVAPALFVEERPEPEPRACARVIGVRPAKIVIGHLLPNVLGPVLVIATINLALAILTEATLSFLGVGLPPTQPSLGTLIRNGNDYLLSGDWWISIFPGIVLAALILSVNLLGDWLRDALNPKLR